MWGRYFNSRTHVECDVYFDTYEIVRHLFQLTHSRGVRREIASKQVRGVEFQLTHSRGVRQGNRNALYRTYAFQLTHSRGVRLVCRANHQTATPFQLTHSRGVRPVALDVLWRFPYNFNSRTHVECDSKYCIKKRFTTQYMGIYCFLSSIILIFFIYSKK